MRPPAHNREAIIAEAMPGCGGCAKEKKIKRQKSKGKSQKAKIKNLSAGPWAGLERDLRGLTANKTIPSSVLSASYGIQSRESLRLATATAPPAG